MKSNCTCAFCRKSFHKKPSHITGNNYCSRNCHHKGMEKNISRKQKEICIRLYKEGFGYNTIAKKLKCHPRKMKQVLLDNNSIKIRTVSEQKRIEYKKHLTNVRRAKIVKCKVCEKDFKFRKGVKEKYCSIKCRSLCEENKQKIREHTLKQLSSGQLPKTNTSIERKVKSFLDKENIGYEYQYSYGYWVYDFKVGNFFIETDGDYWHANPMFYGELNDMQKKNIKRDKQKDTYAKNNGFKVIRFWEYNINNNFEEVKNEILQYCK